MSARDRCIRALSLKKGDIVSVGKSRWEVERSRGVTSYVTKVGTKGKKLYTFVTTEIDRCCIEVRQVFPGSGDVMQDKKAVAKGCLDTGNKSWSGPRRRR